MHEIMGPDWRLVVPRTLLSASRNVYHHGSSQVTSASHSTEVELDRLSLVFKQDGGDLTRERTVALRP